jgi:signal peptidase I
LSDLDLVEPDPELAESPPPAPRRGRAKRPPRTVGQRILEWAVIVAVAVGAAVLLRIFVVQTFYIPSASMTPTLKVGDRIVVDKLAYHLHGVGRGDIIVFDAPKGVRTACETDDTVLVKRVIGLPGETISDRAGKVYIDGKVLDETYLPKNDPATYTAPFHPYHIPANDFFVMGDNRTGSCDSRYWGYVTRSEVIGKVDMRIWPVSRIGFF